MKAAPVTFRRRLQASLKRGALVAAANWPVTLAQAVADALFKLLVAVPLVGGIVIATLVVRTQTDPFAAADWRVVAASLVTSLLSHKAVLAAFVLSLTVVLAGGSLFVALVKGGTVAVLARGEREAGPVEEPPLQPAVIATAAVFSIDRFIDGARTLFPRYARLAFVLLGVYLASGAAYVAAVASFRRAIGGWEAATLLTGALVVWTTAVNLLYLLVQIVIASEDCSIAAAGRRVLVFLRSDPRGIGGVFLVILVLVVMATGASFLAFAALGLISLIPFMWLAAVPLQVIAFVFRACVFQYIDLSAVGAYLTLYGRFSAQPAPAPVRRAVREAAPPPATRHETNA
jgi:hypothetical protein